MAARSPSVLIDWTGIDFFALESVRERALEIKA
jgi:hypothetical protein